MRSAPPLPMRKDRCLYNIYMWVHSSFPLLCIYVSQSRTGFFTHKSHFSQLLRALVFFIELSFYPHINSIGNSYVLTSCFDTKNYSGKKLQKNVYKCSIAYAQHLFLCVIWNIFFRYVCNMIYWHAMMMSRCMHISLSSRFVPFFRCCCSFRSCRTFSSTI